MVPIIALFITTFILLYSWKLYHDLSQNIAAAKSSGIPYIIVPIYLYNPLWMISQKLCEPYLRMLPHCLTRPWLDFIFAEWTWMLQYAGFKKAGHDTFITVSPGGNILMTADAAVISQIIIRGRDFPKPIRMYDALNIYGTNVLSTEGQVWKRHRKITSGPFNEKTNRIVFAESLRQTQALIDFWIGEKGESLPIHTVAEDTLRLSLQVISQVGFGRALSWPVSEGGTEELKKAKDATDHDLSYTAALTLLLENFLLVFVFPMSLMKYLPFKKTKSTYHAYEELGKYLKEMFQNKKEELVAGKTQEGLDLMGTLISASLASEFRHESSQTQHDKMSQPQPILSDSEIIGNSFVLAVAGHETAANSIHFSLVYLALHPSSQRRLQADLDSIFGSRPVSDWNYEQDFSHVFSGVCGAVLAEELRLIPPAINIPKCTDENSPPTTLFVKGKVCHVPPNTYIKLSSTGVHRNPAYWPPGPPADAAHSAHPTSNMDNDLDEFKPERWLLQPSASRESRRTSPRVDDELSHDSTSDTSAALFRPIRGAYIPFSHGQRSCLGRRFAQVEVLTVLAVIFKEYSVELAVEEFSKYEEYITEMGGPEVVNSMGEAGLKNIWDQAAAEVRRMLREEMGCVITIQLRNGKVPLRLVRRGEERFRW